MAAARHQPSSRGMPSTASSSEPEPDEMIDDFRRGRELGRGSFATVYLVQHRKRKSFAAVKVVQSTKLSSKLKANLEKEIGILKNLRHPHIVALFAVKQTPRWYYLVMEYCQLSDLSQFLKKRHQIATLPETKHIFDRYPNPEHGGLNEVISRHFIKQIASALQYLREANLMHRDIKPQNMLLNPSPIEMSRWQPDDVPLAASEYSLVPMVGIQTLPMLKIADFGFARHLPSTSLAETLCGSPLYMAPEILRYERYESRADLWSTGGVLYEMVVGKPPFRAQNHVELLRRIEKAQDVINFDNKNMTISRGMKDLIRKLLKKSPLSRCSWEEFFQDPVIVGDIPGLVEEDKPFMISKNAPHRGDTHLSRRMAKQAIDSPDQARQPGEPSSLPTHASEARTSRRSIGNDAAPAAADMVRRRSSSGVPAEPSDTSSRPMQRQTSQQEHGSKSHRPAMASHATAPARQELLAGQGTPSPSAARTERRSSRASPLAAPPMVHEQSSLASTKATQQDRSAREAQERAAQDVAFEKEYVMIEKRAVEINAFADQLDNQQSYGRGSPQKASTMSRRAAAHSPTNSGYARPVSPSRNMQVAVGKQQAAHQRPGSFERRSYAPSPQSATQMLTKALTAANFRLFGVLGTSPPFGRGPSPPPYNAFPTYPAPRDTLLLGDGSEPKTPMDEDTRIVRVMEEAATRSDVVYGFADVKFKQLVPATPSTHHDALGIRQIGAAEPSSAADGGEGDMTAVAIVGVAEEALVLFVKTLAILTKTIDLAGYWWNRQSRGEVFSDASSPRSANAAGPSTSGAGPGPEVGRRINGIVQWARRRFNDCLEKSEITARRLQAAQQELPLDHPGHPSNQQRGFQSTTASSPAPTAVTASAEHILITSGVTAEKLMFDRAVEMSRGAALHELVGEAFSDCEISYITAIMLLEALLEGDDEPLMRKPSANKGKAGDEVVQGMETEDRQTVIKLIEGARIRLSSLRKKMHTANQQQQQHQQQMGKRLSVGSGSGHSTPRPASHHSPSASPAFVGTPPR